MVTDLTRLINPIPIRQMGSVEYFQYTQKGSPKVALKCAPIMSIKGKFSNVLARWSAHRKKTCLSAAWGYVDDGSEKPRQ